MIPTPSDNRGDENREDERGDARLCCVSKGDEKVCYGVSRSDEWVCCVSRVDCEGGEWSVSNEKVCGMVSCNIAMVALL